MAVQGTIFKILEVWDSEQYLIYNKYFSEDKIHWTLLSFPKIKLNKLYKFWRFFIYF